MFAGERDQTNAAVDQAIARMGIGGPLDQRRHETRAGQMSVVRNRNPPVEIAARHRLHDAEIRARTCFGGIDVVGLRGPVNEARTFGQGSTHARLVQVIPPRARRFLAVRIDRDDFEILDAAQGPRVRCASPS